MKKIKGCFLIMIFLAGSSVAFGAPFLVSDPYPAKGKKPEKFLVTIGEKTSVSIPVKNSDGSLYLKYDLGSLPDGVYTVSVRAVDAKGIESLPGACSFKKTGPDAEIFTPPEQKEKKPPSRRGPSYRSYPGYINK
jgi:hypothetical protein